jgi:hypothetical protein
VPPHPFPPHSHLQADTQFDDAEEWGHAAEEGMVVTANPAVPVKAVDGAAAPAAAEAAPVAAAPVPAPSA